MSREHSQHGGNPYPLPTKPYHQRTHTRQQHTGSDRQGRVVSRGQGHPQHSHGASRSRPRSRPVYNSNTVGRAEVLANQEESKYRDSLCELCSDRDMEVCHHHVSSQYSRVMAVMFQRNYLFYCIMCKTSESTVRPNTRKIILTTSTLYNVWGISSLNLPIHIDIESIVGGRIRDLTRALHMLYLIHPERLEIIVIAGLNNVGDNQPAAEILEELSELRLSVKVHSDMYMHQPRSSVSVSTLLYPPKFCSLDVPDSCTEWMPPAGFHNRRKLVEEVNQGIKAQNLEAQVNYLKVHFEGIRIDSKSGKTMHKHYPEVPIWREAEIRRRLHLTDHYKAKIVRKAAALFSGGLANIGDWPKATSS